MCLELVLMLIIHGALADVANDESKEKRLLLHSDDDIASELMTLKAELASTTKQLETVLAKVTSLEKSQQKADQGAVYTRWGRNVCPSEAQLVYHGYIAGKKWNEPASTSSNLCLPYTPTWGNYSDGVNSLRGGIYGTEIDIVTNIFPYPVNQNDLPCAVCKSTRKTSLMIPARTDCYPGWTLEYTGYLASSMNEKSNSHGSYDTVCLDSLPEFVPHGSTNDDEHILYLMESHCGSLPCPPYVNGRELACAVCTIKMSTNT